MRDSYKKIISFVLVFVFVFSPFLARKAEAQWVVLDPANLAQAIIQVVKDYGLDALAWQIVNLIIERMSASTVKWINSGFQGSPAFVTDPEAYYKDIADKVAGQYIFSNPNFNFLCGPIQAKIRLALVNSYTEDRNRWQCTLTQVGRNMDNFLNNFDNGSWNNFFQMTQSTQNHPIGAFLRGQSELEASINARQGTKRSELNWGQGFMTQKECIKYGVPTQRVVFNLDGSSTTVTDPAPCIEEKTSTPGSVISDQLNKQLGLGSDRLAIADEINELVSALLNKLVSSVVGGIGNGLRGLSEPDATSGGSTFTDQLSNSTNASTVDYFGSSQDTSILNAPVPDPNCMDQTNDPLAPNYDTDPANCAFPRNANLVWPSDPTAAPFTP